MRLPDRPDQTQGPDKGGFGFGWQSRCWDVYDQLGMVHYGMQFIRSNVAMLEFRVARKSDDPEVEAEPVDLDDPAAVELERIGEGPYGGVPNLMAELVVFNQVAGEGYLCGRGLPTDESDGDGEVWEVLTGQQLKKRIDGTDKALSPMVKVRVWRPHPVNPTWPDSPLRSVLAECEELILSRRQVRGALLSRLNNGILLLDESLDPSGPAAAGQGDDTMSPLLRDMWQAFSTAIQEPEAATQIMPYLLMGNDVKDKIDYLALDRPFDSFAIELRDDLTRAIAAGLDLPAERLTGISDSNHWNVWFIGDSEYAQHLAPAVDLVVNGVVRDLLRPAWQAAGLNPDEYTLIVDPTALTSRVRKGADAVLAFDRGALSEDALRRELGFDDGDRPSVLSPGVGGTVGTAPAAGADTVDAGMPDEPGAVPAGEAAPVLPIEELKDRAEVFGILFRAGVTPETAAEAAGIAGLEFTGDEPVTLREPGVSASGLSLVAAAGDEGDDPVVAAALALAAIDAAVLVRLEREVGRVHDRVMSETEVRLRGLLDAAGVDTDGMAATDLARAVAEAGIEPSEAVPDGVYATVAATAGAVLARGQDDAYRTVRRLSAELEREAPQRDDDAESTALGLAVGGLVGSLTSWLREKLFTVAGADPDTGELLAGRTDGINPPLSIMVNAATIAGGGQGATVGSVGVANGQQVESWLDGLSVSTTGWVWQYGDPGMRASQFEPHRRLDGQEFADWESDVLAHSGWPGSRLAPQDHRGCGCGAARVLAATPGVSPTPG
jgi:hypothetical protein